MTVRAFIPTYKRARTITTHKVFEGCEYTVLVHTEQQAEEYYEESDVPPERIHVSGAAPGLHHQRQYVIDELTEPGEWLIFADDNIRRITAVDRGHYYSESLPVHEDGDLREAFEQECTTKRFMREIAPECIDYAERAGARMVGFATTPNFYFRGQKWRTVGYVIGKLTIQRNYGQQWDPRVSMEDFDQTAQHLLQFGAVAVNNFVWPDAGHYEEGGMGTFEERKPQRREDCEYLMQKYPGLFRYKVARTGDPLGDLALRYTQPEQIAAWRARMAERGLLDKPQLLSQEP